LGKGIDNALLTSYRTLSKQNNTISKTLKVIHTKFTPSNHNHLQALFKKAQHELYPVSEAEEGGGSEQLPSQHTLKSATGVIVPTVKVSSDLAGTIE